LTSDEQFNDASHEILQVAEERSQSFTNALHRISLSITDKATDTTKGQKSGQDTTYTAPWPFYTMNNLGVFAQDLLTEDPDILVAYAPLVSQEHRARWEAYSVYHQDMVTTDEIPLDEHLPIPPRPNISQSIYRFAGGKEDRKVDELETAMGPFAPAWQVFPVPSGADVGVVNLNLLSDTTFIRLAEASTMLQSSVTSELEEPQELFGIPIEKTMGYKVGPKEDPQRLVAQPIFADFQDDANVVAYLAATQPWQSVLGGILQDDSGSLEVHAVIKDSCTGRAYTYWVNGTDTVYYGAGDLHESKYNSMNETVIVASYALNNNNTIEDSSSFDYCVVDLSIYPTERMEVAFDSNSGVGYLILILFLATVTLMAFMTHNKAVDQRQRMLQLKTQRSNAIISSLFPEKIRDKLFGDDGALREEGLSLFNSGAQKSLDTMFKAEKTPGLLNYDDDTFEQKQIADLFPNCKFCMARQERLLSLLASN